MQRGHTNTKLWLNSPSIIMRTRRDSNFKHNSKLYQYAIGHRLADDILTLFWKFIDMKKLVLFNI